MDLSKSETCQAILTNVVQRHWTKGCSKNLLHFGSQFINRMERHWFWANEWVRERERIWQESCSYPIWGEDQGGTFNFQVFHGQLYEGVPVREMNLFGNPNQPTNQAPSHIQHSEMSSNPPGKWPTWKYDTIPLDFLASLSPAATDRQTDPEGIRQTDFLWNHLSFSPWPHFKTRASLSHRV